MDNGLTRLIPALAVATAISMTAGCGGGGGGGGNSNGPVADNPSDLAPITSSNAQEISGEVLDNVEETAELGRFGDFGTVGFVAAAGDPSLSKAAVAAATKAGPSQAGGLRTIMTAAFDLTDAPCAVDGTVSISAQLSEQETLRPGDFIEFSFDQCDNGEGEIVDGRVSWSIDTFSGDPDTGFFKLGARLAFDNLIAESEGETGRVSGAIDMLMDTETYPLISASHSGERLTMSDGIHTVVFEDWITAVTADESSQPHAYTWDASGSVDVPEHGGKVTYNVLETFTGFGDAEPDAGVLYVEGQDGGNITLTVLSQGQVQLDIDYDGDGVIDDSKLVTYEDLDG